VAKWLAAAFVAATAALAYPPMQGFDVALRDAADAHRPDWAYAIAVNLNRLGSGGALTLVAAGLAIVAARRHRSWRPIVLVVAAFVLLVAVVQPIKVLVDRPAPHAFAADGVSYPSGHAVNAIVWYGVICALLATSGRLTTWLRVAPPIVVVLTNVYLGFHWFSDMVGGILLGLLLDRALYTLRTSTPAVRNGATSASLASSSVTSV
jgi:membrane-associated phospholipid phosphatase